MRRWGRKMDQASSLSSLSSSTSLPSLSSFSSSSHHHRRHLTIIIVLIRKRNDPSRESPESVCLCSEEECFSPPRCTLPTSSSSSFSFSSSFFSSSSMVHPPPTSNIHINDFASNKLQKFQMKYDHLKSTYWPLAARGPQKLQIHSAKRNRHHPFEIFVLRWNTRYWWTILAFQTAFFYLKIKMGNQSKGLPSKTNYTQFTCATAPENAQLVLS